MGTLDGLALHSAPATHPATPSLRSASPNPPATLRAGKAGWLRTRLIDSAVKYP
jgi:hypothetical protein